MPGPTMFPGCQVAVGTPVAVSEYEAGKQDDSVVVVITMFEPFTNTVVVTITFCEGGTVIGGTAINV